MPENLEHLMLLGAYLIKEIYLERDIEKGGNCVVAVLLLVLTSFSAAPVHPYNIM